MSGLFAPEPHIPSARAPATDAERLSWLRLSRTRRVGAATFIRLLDRFGTADAALEALQEMADRAGGSLSPADRDQIAREFEAGAAGGARLLCLGAPDYPPLLAEIDGPPPALWCVGPVAPAPRRALAVVGTRNASALGQQFARSLAKELADPAGANVAIVSGLARGVDAAAHQGALDAEGATLAVVAGGVDHVYPPEHAALQARIAETGAVLSEMPMGFQPQARHFPRRNRLVSGLALGVLVVEGALRSGSMITAQAALDQGREAMATPGHPLDGRAGAPNALIRDGASLIRSADDALEALAHRLDAPPARPAREEPAARPSPPPAAPPRDLLRDVFASIGAAPIGLDDLARAVGAPASEVASAVLELEIGGRIDREPGDRVRRRGPDAADDGGAARVG